MESKSLVDAMELAPPSSVPPPSTAGTVMPTAPQYSPSGLQPSGLQPSGPQPSGPQPSGLQPSGLQPSGLQPSGLQPGGLQPGGLQPGGLQPGGLQPGGLQPGGLQPGSLQPGSLQPGGLQPGGLQPGGLQPGGLQPGGLQPGLRPSSGRSSPYQTHEQTAQPGTQPIVQAMQQQQVMHPQQEAKQWQPGMQQQKSTQQQAKQQQRALQQQQAIHQQALQQQHVMQQHRPVQYQQQQQQSMRHLQAAQQQPMGPPVFLPPPPTQEQLASFNFDPTSQAVLQSVGVQHPKNVAVQGFVHNALKDVMATAGNPELPDCCQMEYQALLNAILLSDETASDQHVTFTKVVFQYIRDTQRGVEVPAKADMTEGRVYLTNWRLILLSSEETKGLNLSREGNVRTSAYSIKGHKMFSLRYESIPLTCFRGVDMSTVCGFSATARIQGFMPDALAQCLQLCCSDERYHERWQPQPSLSASINKCVVNLGVYLPPWETKCNVQVHMSEDTELANAVDFIDKLQQSTPSLQPESFSIPRQ